MNRLIYALALTPALLTTGAFAQTVSDDVNKALWCGTAFVIVFSNPPEGTPEDQLAEAKVFLDGGNMLIDQATQAHLDAGFTEEQVNTIKSDLVTKVTDQITNSPESAEYKYEDCLALVQALDLPGMPSDEAPADDASSSAMDDASSSAM